MDPTYARYCAYVGTIVETRDLSKFKRRPSYTYMLEHVSPDLGQQYFTLLKTVFNLSNVAIYSFCVRNDRIGSPMLVSYEGLVVSPSSLRYICHAMLALAQCKRVGNLTPSIVELGCGYGGLAVAIAHYAPMFGITVQSYAMIDLDEPSALQMEYMSNQLVPFPVSYHRASTYGKDIEGSDNFFLSSYCFSEIEPPNQQEYLRVLFPKCSHGFILWNCCKIFDIGKEITVEPEVPLTCDPNSTNLNYHVYF